MSQLDTVPTDFAPAIGIAPAEGLESEEGGRIVLEGLPNTRDVGGLPTGDGRYVKHARLLRSGALDHATARDLEVLLDDYQVRTVIDLRTEEERKEHPDPQDGLMGVRFADAPVLSASTFGVTREGGMMQALKMLRTVQKNPASIMEEVYERMMLTSRASAASRSSSTTCWLPRMAPCFGTAPSARIAPVWPPRSCCTRWA